MPVEIDVFLLTEANDYQILQRNDATEAAQRHGYKLNVNFCEGESVQQLQTVFRCLSRPIDTRPKGIVIEPANENIVDSVMESAARAGVGCVLLHSVPARMAEVRKRFPGALAAAVVADQFEIGRIQATQILALAAQGGNVLYLRGPLLAAPAQKRLEGTRDGLKGSPVKLAVVCAADWTTGSGEKVVQNWLQNVLPGGYQLQALACQCDNLAIGARRALATMARELSRPELMQLPVTGVDGLPNHGQKMVANHELAATVIMPPVAGTAVDLLADAIAHGKQPAEITTLPCRSFPDVRVLASQGQR